MPKFSIIVPIYNVEKYVTFCLKSIQEQTFTDFEVLCIDDCGNDKSIELIQDFINNDSRFKIIKHKQNLGLSVARNTGINNAIGDYILFIDSDDWVETSLLECVYNAFQNKDIESVWFNAKTIFEKTKTWSPVFSPNVFLLKEGYIKIKPENFTKFPNFAWNKAYKRDVFEKYQLRYKEGIFFEDSEFFMRAFTNIKVVYYLNKLLYNYRMREDSITTGEGVLKKFEDLFKVIETNYDYLCESNLFEKYKNVLLETFLDRIRCITIKNQRDNIIKLADKTLKHIQFPDKYLDLQQ